MRLVIGAPVQRREWIIEEWLDHAMKSCAVADVDPLFLLLGRLEDPTMKLAYDFCKKNGVDIRFAEVEEPIREDGRTWNHDRYNHMVFLRNTLLAEVRKIKPDLFLSLDTDILLNIRTVGELLDGMGENGYDAIGGKAYMTPMGTQFPSFAFITPQDSLKRYESTDTFEVEVIMAIKLMNEKAYNVDYEWAKQGEDIGWSRAARATGLKLGWCGSVPNKHVMSPVLSGLVDTRCGY